MGLNIADGFGTGQRGLKRGRPVEREGTEDHLANLEIVRGVPGVAGQRFEQRVFHRELIDHQRKVDFGFGLEFAVAGGRGLARRNVNLHALQMNGGHVQPKQVGNAGGEDEALDGDQRRRAEAILHGQDDAIGRNDEMKNSGDGQVVNPDVAAESLAKGGGDFIFQEFAHYKQRDGQEA